MKLKHCVRSLSRALHFSTFSRQVTAARAKTTENAVGFKYLTTTEFATAKTSVWWDVENCSVRKGCDNIVLNIKSALEKNKYCGPVTIYAYGDTNQIHSSVQKALSSTGVSLNHVPPGEKDGSDKKILVDMLLWAMENRAPANVMLISGDGDFSYVLHRLRMIGYNVLLVRPENASPFLIAVANSIWLWRNIVAGGSGSRVPKQADPSKRMNSDLVVQCKSSQRFVKNGNVTCTSSHDNPKALWCSICQVHYPTSGYEEHISGRSHKNKLKVQAGQSS